MQDAMYSFSEQIACKPENTVVRFDTRGKTGARSEDLKRMLDMQPVFELTEKERDLRCLGSTIGMDLIKDDVLQ